MSPSLAPPAANADTPYAGLTPALVLDALDSVGFRGDGRLLQLNSYENRVFQVFLEDGSAVVAKFYRPGRWSDEQILEEHGFGLELAAEEIPVVVPMALQAVDGAALRARVAGTPSTLGIVELPQGTYRVAVTPRQAGSSALLESADQLEWIGRFIGRIHLVGARSSFRHRRTLTPATLGWASRDALCEAGVVPPDAAPAWEAAANRALDLVQAAFDAATALRILRLHGDCHLGNLLWSASGPHFVDLDDAMSGPAVQDLWMLLPGEVSDTKPHLDALLRGYRTFMPFDPRELALIEPLRTLRVIHHSAWLAQRWSDPAFPLAFPWFGHSSYWQEQTRILKEQIGLMQAVPSE